MSKVSTLLHHSSKQQLTSSYHLVIKTMSRIDVHHHVYPPVFTQALNRNGGDPSGWFVPDWTVESDQDLCKQIGVQTAILSVTAPGPACEPESKAAAALARQCNEYVANVCRTNGKSYGFFACLPSLLDTEACLNEIAYAFDTLHADGVVIYTRYGNDNHYLGHKDFHPIWQALNKRQAVVFVHPTHSVDTTLVNKNLPQPLFDYPHETGRTAIDLIVSDTLRTYASLCKIILSHAGGSLPSLVGRTAGLLPPSPFSVGKSSEQILQEASMFYFDTALSSNVATLAGLLQIAKPEHILFGSDFPNAPNEAIHLFTNQLKTAADTLQAQSNGKKQLDLEMVSYKNALKLFPRLNQ